MIWVKIRERIKNGTGFYGSEWKICVGWNSMEKQLKMILVQNHLLGMFYEVSKEKDLTIKRGRKLQFWEIRFRCETKLNRVRLITIVDMY